LFTMGSFLRNTEADKFFCATYMITRKKVRC
jgi:hypothetical protein